MNHYSDVERQSPHNVQTPTAREVCFPFCLKICPGQNKKKICLTKTKYIQNKK